MSVTGIICSPGRTHMMGPSSLSLGFIRLRLESVPHGRVRCSRREKLMNALGMALSLPAFFFSSPVERALRFDAAFPPQFPRAKKEEEAKSKARCQLPQMLGRKRNQSQGPAADGKRQRIFVYSCSIRMAVFYTSTQKTSSVNAMATVGERKSL